MALPCGSLWINSASDKKIVIIQFFSFFLIRQLKSTDMLYRLEKQHIKFIFSPCPSYRWHWPFNQVASLNCLPFLYPLLIRLPVFLPRFSGPALLRFHCLTFSFLEIFQTALWGWLIDDNFWIKEREWPGFDPSILGVASFYADR